MAVYLRTTLSLLNRVRCLFQYAMSCSDLDLMRPCPADVLQFRLLKRWVAHVGVVSCLCFHGSILVSGGKDGFVKVRACR